MMKIVTAAALLFSSAWTLQAGWDPATRTYSTTGYVSLTTSSPAYSDATVFEDPTAWKWPASYGGTPAAMDPAADYCYSDANRVSRTPNTRDFTFNARTLAVNGQFHQSSAYYFTMTNLHLLAGGQFLIWGTASRFTNCTFTVYATRAKPFKANVSVGTGSTTTGFTFANTTIRGDTDAVLTLWGDRATQKYANFWWTGDGSDYRGTVRVEMTSANTTNGISRLYLGPVSLAGTVELARGGQLKPYGTNEVRIARLTSENGGALVREPGDPFIVVTEKITSPVTLRVAIPPGSEEDIDVFRGPPAVLRAATYALADMDGVPLHYGWKPQVREDADGLGTLFLHDAYEVTLVSNVSAGASSPFLPENAACWSDERPPHPAGDYVISRGYYVYMPNVGEYVFPGRSLTLRNKATLNNTTPLVFDCADLRVTNATLRAQACDFTINGVIDVQGPLRLEHYNGRLSSFAVMSTLKGAGDITLSSYVSIYERGSVGSIEFGGVNDAFTGRITVTSPTGQQDYGPVPSLTRCMTLTVADARALGGSRASFTSDALQLEQMSVLRPVADMTLAAKNRGIRIAGCGRFNVPDGVTLTVANPITYAGELRKEGPGTLVLSGAPRFLDGSAGARPLTGTNMLTLAAGSLRVAATNALSGVRLNVGDNARLVVPVVPTDAALRAWGAVNLTEPDDCPFALEASALVPRVTVRFDTTGAASAPPARVWTNALFTVSQAAGARISTRLALEQPYAGYATSLKRRFNPDGSVTLCAVHELAPVHEVTPTSASTPIFTGEAPVVVPSCGCLRFTGWEPSSELGARIVLASGDSYFLPASWDGWSAESSVADASLAICEEDGLIVARLFKDEAAYARTGGELYYTGCAPSGRIRVRVDNAAYGAGSVVPDGDNEYSYTNRTVVSGVTFFGNLRVRQRDARTARAVWTFHPGVDVSASAVTNVSVTFDLGAAFATGSLRSNGEIHKSGTTKDGVGRLEILDTAGVPQLVLELPASNRTYAAQNATKGTATVKIVVPAPAGGFRAAEDAQLVIDLSGPAAVKAAMPPLVTYKPGADWIPTPFDLYVKPGSALDFTDLCGTGRPAGKYGRVKCVGEHFEFAKRPGVPVRFWAVTMGVSAYAPETELCEKGFADLARRGYNATRIHDYESAIIAADDPTATSFDPEKILRFDRYVATAVSNGFYIVLELYGNHRTPSWRSIGENRDGNVSRDEVKSLLLTHEGMFSNQLAYVRAYLTRVNTITKRSLLDEPAVLGVDFVNEHYLGVSRVQDLGTTAGADLKQAWTRYVAAKKASNPAKYASVSTAIPSNLDTTLDGRLYAQFLRETFDSYERRMHAFLRDELKFKALRTNLNNGGPVSLTYSAARRDYTDMHFYQDHPNYLGNGTVPQTFRHQNANPVSYSNAGVPNVALVRQRGKPFAVTEYNYCAPSRFRMAGGLLIGSVAALQGWSGLWQHAYVFAEQASRMGNFNFLTDPLMPAWSRAAAMLFGRGDMPTLPNEYVTRLDPTALESTDAAAHAGVTGASAPLALAAWYARVSQCVTNALPAGVPTSGDWPTSLAKTEASLLADLGLARAADGSLPVAGGGHVAVDDRSGRVAVFTDRTCGGFAEGGTVTAGVFRAELGDVPAAVWASSLDGRPLAQSRHILVSHLTDVQDEDNTYLESTLTTFLSWGKLPHLMRRGTARVTVPAAGLCRVYALSSDGTRREEVPSSPGPNGTCVFTCDTARDPSEATYLYELVCRPGALLRFR